MLSVGQTSDPASPQGSHIAYSYLRLSSDRQLSGHGLRRQMEIVAAYCDEKGLLLDETLKDLGVSGFTGENRDKGALGQFIARVRAGNVPRGSHLIVEAFDRLSRDKVMKAFRVVSELLEAGIIIHTIADRQIYTEQSVSENPGELFTTIGSMLRANEDSRTKSLRGRKRWEDKRRNAATRKLSRRAPLWLVARTNDRGEVAFDPIPERAAIVVRMFEELAGGIGREKIARRLNAEAIKPGDMGGHGMEGPSRRSPIASLFAAFSSRASA